MATKKKEEELAAPEAQSGYDTSGLENRQQVEEAMAGAGYRPGQSVTNAANALKEWQDKRRRRTRAATRTASMRCWTVCWHGRILPTAIRRTRCTGSTPAVHPERPQRQCRCRCTGGSPDRRLRLQLCGQCGTTGLPAADRCAERGHPQPVQSGTGHLHQRRR